MTNIKFIIDNLDGFIQWKIVYGDMSSKKFELENDNINIFEIMLNRWINSQVFSAPSDPELLFKVDSDVGIFFRKFENGGDILLCNSSITPFSSLVIRYNISDNNKFIEALTDARQNFQINSIGKTRFASIREFDSDDSIDEYY